jgi:cytochrome P450
VNARDEDGQALSDQQLRDEAVTMLLAGHETTAIALSYAIFLLSEHPEVASKLRAELESKVGARRLALSDIRSLPYLDAVVKETLRLYPPAWAIGREVISAFELGGYTLSPGDQLIMSPYVMHRHPRFWREPMRFDPERWLDGSTDELPKFAYFPFGGGPRVCIGNHFATMEAQLVLGTLMQHLEMKVLPGFKVVLEPIVTLRPKTGVKVRVVKRRVAPDRAA